MDPILRDFRKINNEMRRRGDTALERIGITLSQMVALETIADAPGGAMTQPKLEAALSVSHPALVKLLRRLAEKGLVDVRPSGEDPRTKEAQVTGRGLAAVREAQDWARRDADSLFWGLAPTEREQLAVLLSKMARGLSL